MKTFDRIVQESLALFNQHGERPITTNHIAAHLGISPGNLYYHFRNKEEIIYQIFRHYLEYMRTHLQIPEHRVLAPEDLGRYLDAAFAAMWQYRFMFYDLPGLLSRNPQLSEDYHRYVRDELGPVLAQALGQFAAIGFINMDQKQIRPLATNIWIVVKFWFAFQQTIHPDKPLSEDTSKLGAKQVLALFQPYVQDAYQDAFAELEARYTT
ncbi:TetR/AcrR family transcriptional regulator [Chitinimonas sp. BJYL2]|uniref:TetR/AcrR family transcriptional regulator n=1 Tax=Chitinimonas sp. BJYL2 TaxID=2976696 RepID=UPI0022B5D603|nr:TetR/AcrR family transcriptional regulator [Chitinimonas sp. BJYL2]